MAKRANVKKIEVVEQIDQIEMSETVVEETKKVEPIKLSAEQESTYSGLKTKSAQIRYLHSQNYSRSQIANYLDIRYQHVRNVLTTELKRTGTKG